MISVLCPTRRRPDNMRRLVDSIADSADEKVEVIFYIDTDDVESQAQLDHLDALGIVGPRIVLSEMWNHCALRASYDVMMHCGDDIVFRTGGWDTRVLDAFDCVPDKILLVHGRDGIQDAGLATHGFIHRRWMETLGYFVPPYFASDYNDLWLTEIADEIGRRRFIPEIYTEHMHPVVGKGPLDATHQERLDRHRSEQVDNLWHQLAGKRREDAAKLRAAIEAQAA